MLPPSCVRFCASDEEKQNRLPSNVKPPPTKIPLPMTSVGSIGSVGGTNPLEGAFADVERKLWEGAHVVLYRNLHRVTDGRVRECEVHRMWLTSIGGVLHLTWVTKSDLAQETRLESVNLSRVISVECQEVLKITTDCGTEILANAIILRTPTQKFGLGTIRKEDFEGLGACMKDCVKTSTEKSKNVTAHYGSRRASLSYEEFNNYEVVKLAGEVTPTRSSRCVNGEFGLMGKGKRRGSNGNVSISSGTTTDSDALDFGGEGEGKGLGASGGGLGIARPVAMHSQMEVVRERGESGVSGISGTSSRRQSSEDIGVEDVAEDKGVGGDDYDGEGNGGEEEEEEEEEEVAEEEEGVAAPGATSVDSSRVSRGSIDSTHDINARMNQLSTFSSFNKNKPFKQMQRHPTGPARRKQSSKQVKGGSGVWGSYVQKTQKRLSKTEIVNVAPSKHEDDDEPPPPPPPPPPPSV
ncbi:hypothetical protein TrCOL_g11211 [Triparma columacea]|uniref:Uncharacterized protein n=1 Tax=Triparma columacea TaxID=722753 RepID=A0A9W7GNR2_9STRA|nr:hypothetical protein TrCOL_g11211 [Triparma columacea]